MDFRKILIFGAVIGCSIAFFLHPEYLSAHFSEAQGLLSAAVLTLLAALIQNFWRRLNGSGDQSVEFWMKEFRRLASLMKEISVGVARINADHAKFRIVHQEMFAAIARIDLFLREGFKQEIKKAFEEGRRSAAGRL